MPAQNKPAENKPAENKHTMLLVQDYYGRVLKKTADLKTSACCIEGALPSALAAIVAKVHPEVKEKFYGCGIIDPGAIGGCTLVDLGCGSGRDVFVLSQLVGAQGHVIGVDMTAEQLAVAKRHQQFHAQAFGYSQSNVTLQQGYIEDLEALDIAANSIDVVVSNCVINLSPAKERVFREIFRILKPGGELHFSDVFADRRLPEALREDPILLGECLGGALYFEDFRRLMHKVGCQDLRVVNQAAITMTNADISRKVGNVRFTSMTVRAFKLDLEDRCEDYGQMAVYRGTIANSPHGYRLDNHHYFETHRPMLVCENTGKMLSQTRFAEHFMVTGDSSRHFGLFSCASEEAANKRAPSGGGECC